MSRARRSRTNRGLLVLGVTAWWVVALATGCTSHAGRDQLSAAATDLASVAAPAGAEGGTEQYVGCRDGAEKAMAQVSYTLPAPGGEERSVDELNAALAEVTEWYVPRWIELGWQQRQGAPGSVFEESDGSPVRASIDVSPDGYRIVVVGDDSTLCDQ